jgi:hypothetical protein
MLSVDFWLEPHVPLIKEGHRPLFYLNAGNNFSSPNESKISASALVSANNSFECLLLGTSPKAENPNALIALGFSL